MLPVSNTLRESMGTEIYPKTKGQIDAEDDLAEEIGTTDTADIGQMNYLDMWKTQKSRR